jgi:hypothetical protein
VHPSCIPPQLVARPPTGSNSERAKASLLNAIVLRPATTSAARARAVSPDVGLAQAAMHDRHKMMSFERRCGSLLRSVTAKHRAEGILRPRHTMRLKPDSNLTRSAIVPRSASQSAALRDVA